MRRCTVLAVVLACVLAGCASATDVRSDLGRSGPARADDGQGQRSDKGSGKKADKQDKRRNKKKGKKKRRNKSYEVRLRHVVGKIKRFSSPSSNIGCVISRTDVRCDINKRGYRPPRKPKACNLAYGNAFSVGRSEPNFVCAGDTVLGAPTTLSYGTATRIGRFGCQSRRDGMRCYNLRTGRGFLVSRASYEFY